MAAIFLHPPPAHFGAKVPCRQFLLGQEYITLSAMWLGVHALINYNGGILHMPVHEMQKYIIASSGSPGTPLNQLGYGCGSPW